jgi:hypothetical protein
MRTTTTNRVSQADRIAEAVDLDLLPPSPPICMAVELYAKYMVAKVQTIWTSWNSHSIVFLRRDLCDDRINVQAVGVQG